MPRNYTRKSLAERFWEKVEKTDSCWLWTGTRINGYGNIKESGHRGRNLRAHRVSYELHHGPIPDGLFVLHRCDNPPCVNPAHLFLGTLKDNSEDMIRKGRRPSVFVQPESRPTGDRNGSRLHPEQRPRGVNNGRAKLSEAQVLDIRRAYERGEMTLRDMATQHGVSHRLIRLIVRREIWQHLPD